MPQNREKRRQTMRDFLLQNGPILAWAITAFHALILILL